MIDKLNWNHVQLEILKNVLWLIFNNYFATICEKGQNEYNFKNSIPNWVRPIAMESPSKCLKITIGLASKF